MLTEEQRQALLKIASESIAHGLEHGIPKMPDTASLDPALGEIRATFVTLELRGNLRGCIGTLEAQLPLAEDIARNAFQAAFRDPRFAPMTREEFKDLDIHISVLSPSEPIIFESEKDLLEKIRPGVDGLVLEDGWHRGTFLPSVWEDLPDKEDFLNHLKMKAGLQPSYWSNTISIHRYTTEYFP